MSTTQLDCEKVSEKPEKLQTDKQKSVYEFRFEIQFSEHQTELCVNI